MAGIADEKEIPVAITISDERVRCPMIDPQDLGIDFHA